MKSPKKTLLKAAAGGLLFLIGGILLAGCAAKAVKVHTSSVTTAESGLQTYVAPQTSEIEELNPYAFDFYVNGLLYEGIGDLIHAVESYRKALEYDTGSCEIALAFASAAYRTGHAPDAVAALADKCPDDPPVLSFKGMLYRRTGDHERARATYLHLARLNPESEDAFLYLAGEYQRLNKLDSAVWAMRELARLRSDSPELMNELGRLLRHKGDHRGAHDAFRHSLKIDHSLKNMAAMLMLSDMYEKSNQPDSAADVFEQVLEWNPGNAQLHREIARIWTERDSVLKALPHLRAIVQYDPSDYRTRRQLAFTYIGLDSLDLAEAQLDLLVEEGPAEAGNHYFLAQIGLRRQDYRKAASEFERVTQLAPPSPDGWLGLAFCRRRLGEDQREIQAYQDGLLQMKDEGDAVQLYFALGAAFERVGQVDSSVFTFEEILKHQPEHVASLNYLGYMLADRDMRLDYARDLISRAVKIEPRNAAYLDSYGWVYYRLKVYDSALFYLSQAAQLDSDPVIYDHLGDTYQANGDSRKAREWWQKALDQQPDNEAIRRKLLEPAEDRSRPAQR